MTGLQNSKPEQVYIFELEAMIIILGRYKQKATMFVFICSFICRVQNEIITLYLDEKQLGCYVFRLSLKST